MNVLYFHQRAVFEEVQREMGLSLGSDDKGVNETFQEMSDDEEAGSPGSLCSPVNI